MRRRIIGVTLAGMLIVALLPAAASADKPLGVDCDLLAATITAVSEETGLFAGVSLGQLIHAAKTDPAVFPLLNGLLFEFSGEEIEFDSISQGVTTIAKCGLIKHLIDA